MYVCNGWLVGLGFFENVFMRNEAWRWLEFGLERTEKTASVFLVFLYLTFSLDE